MSSGNTRVINGRVLLSQPVHAIGGEKYTGWYLDVKTQQSVFLVKGSTVVPLKSTEEGKVLCRVTNRILSIPQEEIEEIGWN
jgi:hypothetical protein